METAQLNVAARKALDLLLERALALRLDLLRTVLMVEEATREECPVLAAGEQDVVCLIAAIRSTQREWDGKEVF